MQEFLKEASDRKEHKSWHVFETNDEINAIKSCVTNNVEDAELSE